MLEKLFTLKKKKYGAYNDMEILPFLLKRNCVRCIMYGSGDMAVWCVDWLSDVYAVRPEFIIDKNPSAESIDGIKVVDFNMFQPNSLDKFFVVVADEDYKNEMFRKSLVLELKEKNAVTIFNAHSISMPYWTDWYAYIKKNISMFENVYGILADEISKNTFEEYLKVYITGERYSGITYPEQYKYWGKDSEDSCLFELKQDEVVLNLGGSCGDTIFQYLKNGFPFEKIISVEADLIRSGYINRSVNMLEDYLRKKIQIDCIFISEGEHTIDKLYSNDHVSLIEMDIEGAELAVLNTGINTIKRERPVLAICAYHKMDDLIELHKFVSNNLKDYVLACRKYPSSYSLHYQCLQSVNELVLYAIPAERYCGFSDI